MRFYLAFVLLPLSIPAAAQETQTFFCGGAQAEIKVFEGSGGTGEAVVSVTHERRSAVLPFRGNIDFIGGECVKDRRGKPVIAFQAYCGGSGCADLENWGIIDSDTLQVYLVPSNHNIEDAARILGKPPTHIQNMLSVPSSN